MRKDIVALILERNSKILLERRKKDKEIGNCVTFPAGHVRNWENNLAALKRVMREELEINISYLSLVYEADFDCEEKQRIFWYSCKECEGEIRNNAEELLWATHKEAYSLLSHEISKTALRKYLSK